MDQIVTPYNIDGCSSSCLSHCYAVCLTAVTDMGASNQNIVWSAFSGYPTMK